jgi:hypothetical protein
LIEGPCPAGLTDDEWHRVRANHLSDAYGVDLEQCQREFADQEKKLKTFADHDEIILWFEHDLFCQVNLLYLLNWFSLRELKTTRLSLVCINQFPGFEDFRGLGQLSADQLASLFPARTSITASHLEFGSVIWQAYCSPEPTAIEKSLETDTSLLPFLRAALRAHLKRFPSVKNGLGAIENAGLELIHNGKNRFIDLFPAFIEAEPIYGLGDAQFWLALRRLSEGAEPLLLAAGDKLDGPLDANKVNELNLMVTERGLAVLAGEADCVTLNGIDMWLGGVHLSSPNNLWRWDEQTEALARRS